MKRITIDNHIIDIVEINKKISKGRKLYHVYYNYNNNYSQLDFIIDIDNIHESIYRIFTNRQLNILLKKLRNL